MNFIKQHQFKILAAPIILIDFGLMIFGGLNIHSSDIQEGWFESVLVLAIVLIVIGLSGFYLVTN